MTNSLEIGLIGSGNIGSTLARLLVGAGHTIAISNSRGPESLAGFVHELGARASAVEVEEAAAFGDLTIEAIPYGRLDELPRRALEGRILVNAANYFPARDGNIDMGGLTHSAHLAQRLPATTVVKGFNAINWQHLRDQGDPSRAMEDRRAIFIAGDDERAKGVVADLVASIGFGPVDIGTLAESRVLEPANLLFTRDISVRDGKEELRRLRS